MYKAASNNMILTAKCPALQSNLALQLARERQHNKYDQDGGQFFIYKKYTRGNINFIETLNSCHQECTASNNMRLDDKSPLPTNSTNS